jgi:UDP-N-acetylmuramate--alanine ligase
MFQKSGTPLVSFIGGMAKNFNGNFVFDENAQIMIAEADEYDRSLLHLKPHSALISTVSPDHLDIYGNLDVLKNTFLEFARSVPGEGNLVINCKLTDLFAERKNLITYGFCKNAMVTATGIEIENQKFKFTINFPGNEKITATMKVPGMHAVENALGVSALAWKMHIGLEDIKRGLESFEGVQRRFDILVNNGDLVIIDDYAHHPDEIDTTLDTARMLFKKKKITVVFQPHLFSRTRDFAEGFARSLDKADNVILLPVYPAREKPLAGVDSYIIFDKMKNKNKIVLEKNMLINELLNNKPEVLILMGAGDIAFLVNGIIKVLA